ncbi:MAG: EpsG family protein, partial [Bacteroidales bacterium]|nr:EpsG family protein [Bacteroidales bacterium]
MMIITFYIFAELTIGGHKINHRFARGIVFLTLWLIAGLRYNVGRDFANYLREFNFLLYGRVSWIDFEPGYRLLSSAIALFTTNAQYLFLVTSFITLWFVFKAIDKHSESFYLSLFLFVAMYFYFNSFNEVRHYMAVSISFYGTRYLAKRDFTKYAITIVIASLFHYSALIMLFAYFFVTRNYRRTTYLMAIGIAVLIRILYFRIIPIVVPLIPRYANYLYYHREGSSATLSVVIAGLIFCIA